MAPAVAGLGGLLALAVYYLLPAGLANYAREDRFLAALSAILVGVFVGFYVGMTVFYIYGRSAAEAHGPGSRTTVAGGLRTV